MLRLLLALCFALPVFAAAPTFVNAVAAGNSAVSSAQTAATSHTTGNLLHVIGSFRQGCGAITMGVSDTAGNTFTPIGSLIDNTTNMCVGHWYAKNITGGASNQVTLTASTTVTNIGMTVLQYSGALTTTPLDVFADGSVSSGGTATTSAFTTTSAEQVISCGLKSYNFGGNTPGTGYTIPSGATDGYHGTQSGQYKTVTSIQTGVTAFFTNDTANINTIVCATFTSSAAPPPSAARRRVVN